MPFTPILTPFTGLDPRLFMSRTDDELAKVWAILDGGLAGPAGPAGPAGQIGPAGADGTSMVAGAGAPTQNAPVGSLYLDSVTGDLYQFT